MKQKRLKIPDDVKLKLWIFSGGRCEFPGCNKYVWRDGLTLKEGNYAHMAHIVAASPDGPRGDEIKSVELERDFENLLLLCFDHSHLVDGKNKAEYTLEELQRYKKIHEDRIRRQTELQPEMSTTVLRFMANIGDRPVKISLAQTYNAILPRYPADDKGILMDFTNRTGSGESTFWQSFSSDIILQTERALTPGNDRTRPEHVSIFALGPIPLLIQLGRSIGNTISADIYQRHRDTEDWIWKTESDDEFEYKTEEVAGDNGENVAIALSLSGKIHNEEIYKSFEKQPYIYSITIESPNPGFLDQKSKLQKFRDAYRSVLSKIRETHGGKTKIHLFPAIPAPIAVICGRELLPKVDPLMVIYDHEKEKGGFIQTLTIN